MKVIKYEGSVYLENNGKSGTLRENQRLQNGNALKTTKESLVAISLDDKKIVTLDENSRAEFNQKGKKLVLNLTEGNVFFNVTEPLKDDESFTISTATMVVGIRGTSGYVASSVEGIEHLIITDGKVAVTGLNPVSGEKQDIDVDAGEMLTVSFDDTSLTLEKEEIDVSDLPEFAKARIGEDVELQERVFAATGWDNLESNSEFKSDEIASVMRSFFAADDPVGFKNYFFQNNGNYYNVKPGLIDALADYKFYNADKITDGTGTRVGGIYLLGGNDLANLQKDDIVLYVEQTVNADGTQFDYLSAYLVIDPSDANFKRHDNPDGTYHNQVDSDNPTSAKLLNILSDSQNDRCIFEYIANKKDYTYVGVGDTLESEEDWEYNISCAY